MKLYPYVSLHIGFPLIISLSYVCVHVLSFKSAISTGKWCFRLFMCNVQYFISIKMYVSVSFLYLYISIFLDDDKDSLHSEGNTEKTTDASTQVTDQTESTEYQPKEQSKGSYEAAVAIGTNNIHIQEAEGPFDRLGECEKQKEHFDHCESTCKLLSCHFSTLKICYLLYH